MLLDTQALANRVETIPISLSTSGDHTIVSGVVGKVITLVKALLLFGGTTTFTVKDGTNALSGAFPFSQGMSMVLDLDPWYSTSPGNSLVFNMGSPVVVAGTVWYVVGYGTS